MTPPAKHGKQNMTTKLQTNNRNHRDERQYALRRGLGFWELTFEGRGAIFKHELGALYVACLLLDPPREPIHAVALALKAREMSGQAAGPCEGAAPEDRRAPEKMRGCPPKDGFCPPIQSEMKTELVPPSSRGPRVCLPYGGRGRRSRRGPFLHQRRSGERSRPASAGTVH
jgi:hypothetical protein